MVWCLPVSLMASRALFRCAMQHIASRHAVVGSGRSMLSSHRFAPSTFLLHSLSSSSPPSSSRGARFFSGGRPPPSGLVNLSPELPSDALLRKTEKQLADLKGEIDAAAAKIDAEKAEWKKANAEDRPIILKSIDVLNSRLERLIATRDKLIDASIAAQVPAPGKSTPLRVFCPCAVDAPLFVCVGD